MDVLEQKIRELEEENAWLREQLAQQNSATTTRQINNDGTETDTTPCSTSQSSYEGPLTPLQIERYSRQLLLRDGFGTQGQQALLKSNVLIVGAGGIGSTVILYLAAAGIGHMTIVDFDSVEISNLHRQVIHSTQHEGVNKAESARRAVLELNPTVRVTIVKTPLTSSNAFDVVSRHDVVVDATDNPQTRYLINDACVLSDRPLVSGSAMGMEGQLTVYHYRWNGGEDNDDNTQKWGPCYRCLYPTPNATEGSKSCADNGVLGPVPGLIGVLQAVEVMKLLTNTGSVLYDKMLMYDALQGTFLRIQKPPKQPKCPVCGTNPTIRTMEESYRASQQARGPTCGGRNATATVPPGLNISACDYAKLRQQSTKHILLDVRVKEQFELCHLPGSVNVPLSILPESMDKIAALSNGTKPVYCLCRRGNASATATQIISDAMNVNSIDTATTAASIHSVMNISGGLDAWRIQVDPSFPRY
jgi:adenylyltransferase/sulfurtransferase